MPGVPRAICLRSTSSASGMLARVHREDALAPAHVRPVDDDLAVEAAGPQQRRIEHVGPVGGRDHDDAFVRVEAVHLDQQLVQRLLALVVPAAEPRAAMAADGVDLVDEDDARRVALALLEEIAHAATRRRRRTSRRSPSRDIEKNGTPASPATAFASSVLPEPGGPEQQRALRDPPAQPLELLRLLQELDDLLQLLLGLVAAGDVLERDLGRGLEQHACALVLPNLSAALPPACIWRSTNSHGAEDQHQRQPGEQHREPVDARRCAPRSRCRGSSSTPGRAASAPSPRMFVLNALNGTSWPLTRIVRLGLQLAGDACCSMIWRFAMLPRSTSWMKRV